jgi:RHS repeat-associated protein
LGKIVILCGIIKKVKFIRAYISQLILPAKKQTRRQPGLASAYARKRNNGNAANPFTYTGREDVGLGLMYYRNRYYDSAIERFISDDPLGDGQRYVGNNPLGFVDPLGLELVYPQYGGKTRFTPNLLPDSDLSRLSGLIEQAGIAELGLSSITLQGEFAPVGYGLLQTGQVIRQTGSAYKGCNIAGGRITGYSRHALDRIGIGTRGDGGQQAKAILEAVKNPKQIINQANGRIKYIGKNGTTVVTEANGEVVTGYGRSPRFKP